MGLVVAKPVAKHDDLTLALIKHGVHKTPYRFALDARVRFLGNILVGGDHVHVGKGIAVSVHVDRFVDRHLGGELLLRAEMHQDLVLNTFGGVGCKARAVLRIERIYRLHKTDTTDRNEILLIFRVAVVFAHDMGNKAQIVQNEFFARFHIAALFCLKRGALLCGA